MAIFRSNSFNSSDWKLKGTGFLMQSVDIGTPTKLPLTFFCTALPPPASTFFFFIYSLKLLTPNLIICFTSMEKPPSPHLDASFHLRDLADMWNYRIPTSREHSSNTHRYRYLSFPFRILNTSLSTKQSENGETCFKKESPDKIPQPDLRTKILVVSTLWGSSHCKPRKNKNKNLSQNASNNRTQSQRSSPSLSTIVLRNASILRTGDSIHRSEQNSHMCNRRVSLGPSGRGSSGGSVWEHWMVTHRVVSGLTNFIHSSARGWWKAFGFWMIHGW